MTSGDFEFLSKLLYDRSGLVLTPDKMYLLESRLMPIARKREFRGLDELVAQLRLKEDSLTTDVIEAMTTNESFFFRDIKPFEQFRTVILPNLLKTRAAKKHIRIWCAAASSGQEPYSLGMILKEEQSRLIGWRLEIIATDLSREILDKARLGVYTQFEVQRGLPIQMLLKYFHKRDDQWEINPSVRSMVQFKQWNLLQDLSALGQFDVVFCRNVLIYFDQPTKTRVLEAISKQMADDGVLYLGGAETVLGVSDRFKSPPALRGVYSVVKPGYFGPTLAQ